MTQAGKMGFFRFLPTYRYFNASKIVKKPNYDLFGMPFNL
jgi:hypothetical protein